MSKKETYIKRITTFLLTIIMFASCFIPTIAYAEEQNVDAEEAKYLAIACVWDVQSCTDSFNEEVYYSNVFTLYDSSLNPSAYVVNFKDKNGDPNGYVVIGATSDNTEIIEFSDEGLSPYEEQYRETDKVGDEKIYAFFEGNISPTCIDKSGKNFVEKQNGKLKKTKIREKKSTFKYSVRDRKSKADKIENLISASGGNSSSLSASDFPITSVFDYETGYKTWTMQSVPYFEDVTYKTQNDYSDYEEICGPLAATNLMKYWKRRDSSKYTSLMRGDASWDKTFHDLRGRMHFFNTTSVVLFASGVDSFMDEYSSNGATVNWNFPNANNWNTVVTEIGNKRPIVLLLQGHSFYGYHYVVAFEYLSFEYADGTYSNYVQICDGKSSTANRYINFTKGFNSGSIYTITVHPN